MASSVSFPLGRTVITAAALKALPNEDVLKAMARHACGDWGEVGAEDARENESSLLHGWRLFSVYHAANGRKFWIITEANRSATTVLLPEDY